MLEIHEIPDPIHQNKDGKWYFWDENWAYEHGPYNTRIECQKALGKYVRTVLGE